MNLSHEGAGAISSDYGVKQIVEDVTPEPAFHRMIALERKRSERSRKPFVLMLVDVGDEQESDKNTKALRKIASALSVSTRETDVIGWYEKNRALGVMFIEIGPDGKSATLGIIVGRITEALRVNLAFEQFNRLRISFHVFPDDWKKETDQRPCNPTLYPDVMKRKDSSKYLRSIKRAMDIGGSLIGLALASPVFLAIAAAIKLTSQGPVFFRQIRIGQYGERFVFLKFRSMYLHNDSSIHREYVNKLIAGKAEKQPSNGNGAGVYKLTRDSRITPVGAFLRKTSLDELPQFINVLRGEMSLVGPRPPIPYEVEAYDIWHRSRVLEAKPGITGLWQVNGRSQVKFDDMVRLDLQYARSWSPWMDLKILLRTPAAIVGGEGAH